MLAAGQLLGIPTGELSGVELDGIQKFVDARCDFTFRPSEQLRYGGDVLGDGEVREEADLLDDIADVASKSIRIEGQYVLAVDPDRATARLDDPVDHLHGRRLAASTRPDKHDQFTRLDAHREAIDGGNLLAGIHLRHVVELDGNATPGSRVARHESVTGELRHEDPLMSCSE